MWVQDVADSLSRDILDRPQTRKLGTVRHFPERRKSFSLGIMEKGVVGIYSYSIIGNRRMVRLLGPGDIVVDSQIAAWPGNAESATAVVIRCMDKFMLDKLATDKPKLFGWLADELAQQSQAAQEVKCAINRLPADGRLALFLTKLIERPLEGKSNVVSWRRNPVVGIPISRDDLASYLGLSPAKLNQAVQILQQCGIIRLLTPRHFEILNLRSLGSLLSL